MRRWFVLLLIVLMPLRAWAGSAMAGEMMAGPHHEPPVASASPSPATPHDCHGDEAASEDSAPAPVHGSCATCSICQVCSAVALPLAPQAQARAANPAVPCPTPAPDFASADALSAFKPPIS